MPQRGLGIKARIILGGSPNGTDVLCGKEIVSAELVDNQLKLQFADGAKYNLWDDGQDCCERRYITTDDDISSLVGQSLTRIETKDGPDQATEENPHEKIFVELHTATGCAVVLTTHNEHDGYYGGFILTIKED